MPDAGADARLWREYTQPEADEVIQLSHTIPANSLAVWQQSADCATDTAFIARCPHDALRWMCATIPKPALLAMLGRYCDNEPSGEHKRKRSLSPSPPSPQLQGLYTYGLTSLDLSDKHANDLASKSLYVAGVDTIAEWKVMMQSWRHASKTRVSTMPRARDSCQMFRDMPTLAASRANQPMTQSEREIYMEVQRTRFSSPAEQVWNRCTLSFIARKMQARFEYLAEHSRTREQTPKRIATVAKDMLFAELYNSNTQDAERWKTRQDNPHEAHKLDVCLAYGRKWGMLEEEFGIGIFAMLPATGISNTWVERMPVQRLQAWIAMLRTCYPCLHVICVIASSWVRSLLSDEAPPHTRLALENTQDDEEIEATVGLRSYSDWFKVQVTPWTPESASSASLDDTVIPNSQ